MSTIEIATPGFGDGITLPDFEDMKKSVIEELALRIQARTPVDTGNARDGWNIDGDSIVNMVPYIIYLENGWSSQAPAGMIRISLLEVPDMITRYIAEHQPVKVN